MQMQRYFIPEKYKGEEIIALTGEDFHHISRVMRMKKGDRFYLVFSNGETAIVRILDFTDEEVIVSVAEWEEATNELPIKVTIASGLPKADKLEYIVQKGTELGAYHFIPFNAERSIVKWNEKKEKKIQRLEKIAKEAAEQSHRNMVPSISRPVSWKELLDIGKGYQYKLVAYEEIAKQGEEKSLATFLTKLAPGDKILIVFGPEGGLSAREISDLVVHGFELCGLGPRILRTETAPLYALSAVSYHFELMR